MAEYNHNRPIEDFEEQLSLIRNAGFNPIGVSQLMFEDTFIFETGQEATEAHELLEKNGRRNNCVVGWWYGKDDFIKTVEEYEQNSDGIKVQTHWI